MDKKGYFFTVDALIALIVVILVIIVVKPVTTNFEPEPQIQEDLMKALSSIKIKDLDNSYAQTLISNGTITNLNNTVLEQLGEFYALSSDNAENLANSILNDLNLSENVGIFFNDAKKGEKSRTPYENAVSIKVSRQVISGIQQGEGIKGYSSRAFLASKNKVKYFYFGGYVGDGNLSSLINYSGQIAGASIEATFSKPFTLYINGQNAGNYTPTDTLTPYKIDLSNHLNKFVSGNNLIEFRSQNPMYIGGGFIKIRYNSEELLELPTRKNFPGINGSINLYDSVSIPGNLTNLEIFLHYYSNYDVFMTVGNITIYNVTPTGETSKILNNTELSGILNYTQMSGKTTPIRFGLVNTTYNIGNFSGKVDVFSVTDLSGSMAGSPLAKAKNANKNFTNVILNYSGNRVGLIGYSGTTLESQSHNLSNDSSSLISKINSWTTSDTTCICCGINSAIEKFFFKPFKEELIIYYPFEGNLNDYSGNNRNGQCSGNSCPTYIPNGGPFGSGAYYFDGINDEVQILNVPIPQKGSLTVWINKTQDNIKQRFFGGDNVFEAKLLTTNGVANDLFNDDGIESNTKLKKDRWYFVVLTWDHSTNKQLIYINGVLDEVNGVTNSDPKSLLNISLGQRYGMSTERFNGMLDDLRLYSKVLNENEIKNLYREASDAGTPNEIFFEAESNYAAPFTQSTQNNYQVISQSIDTQSDPSNGGKANYTFTITKTGSYIVRTSTKAQDTSQNSFFAGIDMDPPISSKMIWDIYPTTNNSFSVMNISWRGSGDPDTDQYNPKIFILEDGVHNLIIRGREPNTYLDNLTITKISTGNPNIPSCGNNRVEMGEVCDGNSKFCTSDGFEGTQTCNAQCNGFNPCNTNGICGDWNVNQGEQCDDGNTNNGDGCSSTCQYELRIRSIVVMSDGEANVQCPQQGTGSATQDAIQAACTAYNDYNITVHAVGFGSPPVLDETTLQGIASCGHGNYYYASINDLSQIYQEIAKTIIIGSFVEQTISTQDNILTTLFPDSYILYNYIQPVIPIGILIYGETPKFGNNISVGTLFKPDDATILEVNALSYSGSKWTSNVSINNKSIYSLNSYGNDFINLGDPYSIIIPPDKITNGTNNIKITTGLAPGDNKGGSPENKAVYSMIRLGIGYSPILATALGCTWTIQLESGENTTINIPNNYTGTSQCYYTINNPNGPISYNQNDAINKAVYNLLRQLDLDLNNLLDTPITSSDISIETSEVSGIPFTWETEVQIRVWR